MVSQEASKQIAHERTSSQYERNTAGQPRTGATAWAISPSVKITGGYGKWRHDGKGVEKRGSTFQ